VLGEWGFRRLTLSTDRRALVPRPETEVVVERALELIAGLREPRVLDAGTGSGAIALAIADERPDARVLGLDSSADALELARENARRTGLAGRVRFVRGDFRMGLPGGPYELVVSNPPYVSPDELDDLAPEIRLWEPREALVGGIELVSALASAAERVLAAGGCLVVEASELRAGEAAEELRRAGYRDVAVTADLAGRPRVVEGRLEAAGV
jgi:release factor glutamine methyltransferase